MNDDTKPYRLLTCEERLERARWAAKAMRELPEEERDYAIAGSYNVTDARNRFEERRWQAELARTYRSPQGPNQ